MTPLDVPVVDIAPFRTGGIHEKRTVASLCIDSCTNAQRPAKYPPVLNGDYLTMKFGQQNALGATY
jgi:hypothetical protein